MDLLETMYTGQPLSIIQRAELIELLHLLDTFTKEGQVTADQGMEFWLRIRKQYVEWVKAMERE